MEPAATIGRLGFRRWYERQLIEGHAWLVTLILCLVAIGACVETMSFRGPRLEVLGYAAAVVAACRAYARFKLIGSDSRSLTVRCRKCAHEWRID